MSSFRSVVRLDDLRKNQDASHKRELAEMFIASLESRVDSQEGAAEVLTLENKLSSEERKGTLGESEREFIDPGLSSISTRRETEPVRGTRRTSELSDNDIKESLEEDLLGLVGRMKAYSRNYKEQLTRDNQVLSKISKKQDQNLSGTDKEMKSLIEFEKMSNELGFWRLLMMGLIAIALFMVTIMFIFFTSFFR